jgi:putative oxidoreductase
MDFAPLPARRRVTLTIIRGLAAFAFVSAGILKLVGVPMMVDVFEHVGFGQWFRYATGVIEVGSAILLLSPRYVGPAASLLSVTMIGAIISHLIVVPGSPGPAVALLTMCLVIAWSYRDTTLGMFGSRPAQRVAA